MFSFLDLFAGDGITPRCRRHARELRPRRIVRGNHIDVNYLDFNIIDFMIQYSVGTGIFHEIRIISMKTDTPAPVHTWLVMMKAMQAITRYALANFQKTGLGFSDFAVLEALLHKGPLPVNVIGPKVNLTPGSISVAVDRLVAKDLVSRDESSEDRRVRIVALTPRGKSVIAPIFRAHAATMEKVFSGLSHDELRQLERQLKRVGKQAESLFERCAAKGRTGK